MHRLMMMLAGMACPMAEAGAGGGGSAAAAIAGSGAGAGGGDNGAGGGAPAPQGGAGSAAAAIAGSGAEAGAHDNGAGAGGGDNGAGGGAHAPQDVDLSKLDDEAYAKLVQPDVEGETVDRTLITPMAKELREAGIQPRVMAKVGEIYRKVVKAEVEKDEAARAARMKELTAKCLAETTDEEKRDFAAAYAEHIAKDAELKRIVDTTELGSNGAFIRLIALAGATLRAERTPPAAAAAGSSQVNTDRAVFEATVPKHLR